MTMMMMTTLAAIDKGYNSVRRMVMPLDVNAATLSLRITRLLKDKLIEPFDKLHGSRKDVLFRLTQTGKEALNGVKDEGGAGNTHL